MSGLLIAAKNESGSEYSIPRHSGIVVAHRPHPFDLKREVVQLPEGGTIADCLEVIQPDAAIRAQMVIRLGGEVIPTENWRLVRPKAGTFLEAIPMPTGGGNTLRTVLTIAIVAAAMAAGGWIAGPTILGAGGLGLVTSSAGFAFASAAIGGALPLAGPIAIGAILPPGDPS